MTMNVEGMRAELQNQLADIDRRIREAQAEQARVQGIMNSLDSVPAEVLDFMASRMQPPAQERTSTASKRGARKQANTSDAPKVNALGDPIKRGRQPAKYQTPEYKARLEAAEAAQRAQGTGMNSQDQSSLDLATQEATPPEDDGSHPHANKGKANGKGRKAGVASAGGNEGA